MSSFYKRLLQSRIDRAWVDVRYRLKGDAKHRTAQIRRCTVAEFQRQFKPEQLIEFEIVRDNSIADQWKLSDLELSGMGK